MRNAASAGASCATAPSLVMTFVPSDPSVSQKRYFLVRKTRGLAMGLGDLPAMPSKLGRELTMVSRLRQKQDLEQQYTSNGTHPPTFAWSEIKREGVRVAGACVRACVSVCVCVCVSRGGAYQRAHAMHRGHNPHNNTCAPAWVPPTYTARRIGRVRPSRTARRCGGLTHSLLCAGLQSSRRCLHARSVARSPANILG